MAEAFRVTAVDARAIVVVSCRRCDYHIDASFMTADQIAEYCSQHRAQCPGGWKGYAAYTIRPERAKGRRTD